jgi:hypothetical protein
MTNAHMPPLVSELKEKKSQNLFGFGETLPGCLTFCTKILCTKSATVIKQRGIIIAKPTTFYGFFTTAYQG